MPPSSSPERALQQQDQDKQHRSPSPARAAARVLGKLERLQAKVRKREGKKERERR
jgi:hypothetical protein